MTTTTHQKPDTEGVRKLRLAAPIWALLLVFGGLFGAACAEHDDGPPDDGDNEQVTFKLNRFADCDSLDDYLTDVISEMATRAYVWGYYGYARGGAVGVDDMAEPGAAPPGEANADSGGQGTSESPTDYSTTNVQEEGVDEPDLTKTDGEYIYVVQGGWLYIVDSWPPADTELVASFQLSGQGDQMFLAGDRIVTFTSIYEGGGVCDTLYAPCYGGGGAEPTPDRPTETQPAGGGTDEGSGTDTTEVFDETFYGTRISVIDITDRASPELVAEYDIEGSYVSARMTGGIVYLATMGQIYDYDYELIQAIEELDLPEIDYDSTYAERMAYEPVVRNMVTPIVADWVATKGRAAIIPDIRVNGDERADGFACDEIFYPGTRTDLGMLNLVALDPNGNDAPEGVGLLANGWISYASQSAFYVAQDSRWWMWPEEGERWAETHVHRFDLNDGAPDYGASGSVPGFILNQFSMSEYQGHLRIATTNQSQSWWWPVAEAEAAPGDAGVGTTTDAPPAVDAGTASGEGEPVSGDPVEDQVTEPEPAAEPEEGSNVFVLAQNGEQLDIVGEVTGLAPGEQIFAVRFQGDKGYVVTFRQMDPLFTIDLSDPTDPRLVGELHITGFSTYLHPVDWADQNLLLAIGREADAQGFQIGLQLQMFDVSDMANPQRIQQLVISNNATGWASSMAEHDHRAFTFWSPADLDAEGSVLGYLGIPVTLEDWSYDSDDYKYFSGIIVYEVSVDNGFVEVGRVSHSGMATEVYCGDSSPECGAYDYFWYTQMLRSTFIEGYVYAISNMGLTVSTMEAMAAPLAEVVY